MAKNDLVKLIIWNDKEYHNNAYANFNHYFCSLFLAYKEEREHSYSQPKYYSFSI